MLAAAGPLSRLVADKGYDANRLRQWLKAEGTKPAGQTKSKASDPV